MLDNVVDCAIEFFGFVLKKYLLKPSNQFGSSCRFSSLFESSLLLAPMGFESFRICFSTRTSFFWSSLAKLLLSLLLNIPCHGMGHSAYALSLSLSSFLNCIYRIFGNWVFEFLFISFSFEYYVK